MTAVHNRIILDLCGGTGAWSQPYKEAGYDVRVITQPEHDVRLFKMPIERIHGVLCAPPCTYFCTMRQCRGKPTDAQLLDGLSIVDACLRIIYATHPVWWALENPEGSLKHYLGQPRWKFQPYDYGDPWTKKTLLWGQFSPPMFSIGIDPQYSLVSSGKNIGTAHKTRSITPPGFARAFYEANP